MNHPLLRLPLLGTLLLAFLLGCDRGETPRMIVLGIDGMDPVLLRQMMQKGKMKNFERLEAQGGFKTLATSMPPQSPVAWSNFITGLNPGGHGIFDFLRHDRETLRPATSTAAPKPPDSFLGIPVGGGGMENLRKGKAFWQYLEEAGVPATVFRMPANFPPVGDTTRGLSGMGTPDLRGSDGQFTLFTDVPPANAAKFTGGIVVRVEVTDNVVRTELAGPPNGDDDGSGAMSRATTPLTVYLDAARKVARVQAGNERHILTPGEWSDWVRVDFSLVPGDWGDWARDTFSFLPGMSVSGIVRFYLKELEPGFQLYTTPVNIDPASPAMPISTPAGGATDLCCEFGPFYTQGMPQDTKALQWGVFTDEEFLEHAWGILRESERLLDHEIEGFRGKDGLFFFYFSTIDLCCHVLWRTQDPEHPAYREDFPEKVKTSIPRLYQEMDRLLGKVLEEVDDRTTLLVMSDHGFAPFNRAVNLNNWLIDKGYLRLYGEGDPAEKSVIPIQDHPDDVAWLSTRAYAFGFNGIYLNLFGPNRDGVVTPKEKGPLLAEIEAALLAWVDPKNGKNVVKRVYRPDKLYSGPYVQDAPDLIVGYARGYRASWHTPLGGFGPSTLEDNVDAWSGDHLMAADEVPGVLLSNRPLSKADLRLEDLTVTILDVFGISPSREMNGRSVLEK
jgi:predicted AlkP superfamily phosphohydrolase/phosphomutase